MKLISWPHTQWPTGLRQLTWLAVLLTASVTTGRAAFEGLTQNPIFVSGTGGYHTYRIPALIISTNGTILAFCEGRKNSRSDTGKIDLLLKRSQDEGRTWSPTRIVWSDQDNVCGNPAPVVDRDTGKIWLLMTWNGGSDTESQIARGTSRDTRRVFVTHSNDDGLTWSRPREITEQVKQPAWRWYATGPGNGIQLTQGPHQGRLIIPANHNAPTDSGDVVTHSHIIYSDDHGRTWHIGGVEDKLTNESTVVELSDGTLLHNMRSYHGKHRRAIARSRDGGVTWSPVTLDETLIEPVCQASILRYSWPHDDERSRIIFSNPASTRREMMTVRLSYDEGHSWPVSRLLNRGPSAYSSLAVLPDNTIACLYERGEKSPYEEIVFARFTLQWLEGPSDDARLQWQQLEPWPGPARMLAVAGAHDEAFYLFSGAELQPGAKGQPVRRYLTDAYRFSPGQGWRRLADLPRAATAAPSPAIPWHGKLLVVSGDDGAFLDFEPKSKHPGFPKDMLVYDPAADRWSRLGESPLSRATAPVVQCHNHAVILNGETRPGQRTPQVWALSLR